jgi:lipopolysaccharide/colanic/teichoic acid biosynthesis glycosyltransferase
MEITTLKVTRTVKRKLPNIKEKEIQGDSYSNTKLPDLIAKEYGLGINNFIAKHLDVSEDKSFITSTSTRFNIDKQKSGVYSNIVNLRRINDSRWVNKFFESVNHKLPNGGLYISYVETYSHRKKRILKKLIIPFNWIHYTLDFFIFRVLPKLPFSKRLYFYITKGKGRVMSKAETLGRLYSCGFEIIDESEFGNKLCLVAKKVKPPIYDLGPTYGPVIKLKRSGKNGKEIMVYKLRTMHPYSEYIQKYIYDLNGTSTGDKADNDFRINTLGSFFRKFWIDELPMLINLFRGDIKIVGVRPLSSHKLSIYPKELQKLRKKHKPGLVPPYYSDMPNGQQEMWESERNYLLAYDDSPLKTDIKYFFKAFYNIIFRHARSG